jgi:UDP-glucose 4-epimerase
MPCRLTKSVTTVGVTGAAGFIGGALLPELRRAGFALQPIDNFSGPVTVVDPATPVATADLRTPKAFERLEGSEVVLHLGAVSGVMACAEDPSGSREVNVQATAALVSWCRERHVPLAFASSFAVVGIPAQLPITESTPARPTHEYARQKAEGESLVRALSERGGPRAAVLRMSNVYGGYRSAAGPISKGNVLTLFAQQARTGRLRVNAPGTQRRDFIHLSDVLAHWVAIARTLTASSGPEGAHVYNVASGETATIVEVAERFQKIWGELYPGRRPLEMEIVPNPRGAIELLQPEFEVDRRATEERLGVRCRERIDATIRTLLEDSGRA